MSHWTPTVITVRMYLQILTDVPAGSTKSCCLRLYCGECLVKTFRHHLIWFSAGTCLDVSVCWTVIPHIRPADVTNRLLNITSTLRSVTIYCDCRTILVCVCWPRHCQHYVELCAAYDSCHCHQLITAPLICARHAVSSTVSVIWKLAVSLVTFQAAISLMTDRLPIASIVYWYLWDLCESVAMQRWTRDLVMTTLLQNIASFWILEYTSSWRS